ncbi:MAG: type II toxin-antitoxin system Phd/YefM family antitoxin [Spirochaetaceae bacterium]|nr:type II toxin-antitoxin system Phd/YefM family antitoxin [Spirochaetaceae bacterium]
MRIFNYSEARQNFAAVLNKSLEEEVIIKRKDGTQFKIIPIKSRNEKQSPFDVEGIDTDISLVEILDAIRESREDNRGK